MGRKRRVMALTLVVVMVATVFGGVALTHGSGGASSGTITVHPSASHDTVMSLHDGVQVRIPAGALPASATVTATYVSAPTTTTSGEKPIGTQVQISIQSSATIQQPIELDWPLPKTANALAARFGVYRLGTFDAGANRWQGVETSYDPSKQLLSAFIAGPGSANPSITASKTTGGNGSLTVNQDAYAVPTGVGSILRSLWSTVQEVTDGALSLVTCVADPNLARAATVDLVKCIAKEFTKSNRNDLASDLITSILPKSCVGKLIVDQALSYTSTLGLELVVGPVTLLVDMAREPACRGGHGMPTPTTIAVSPTSGPTKGGNAVRITGTPIYLIRQITFGGTPASFRLDFKGGLSSDAITVTAPPHAAGTVDVRLTNEGGSSPLTPSDQYTYR